MQICVEYNLSDSTAKTLTFSNIDFLRATGIDWARANKLLRIEYIKDKISSTAKVSNTEFCYLMLEE